jgi:hypothetical protein
MKFWPLLFKLTPMLVIMSCENNIALNNKGARRIASDQWEKIDGKEKLAEGIRQLLYEEQNFSLKEVWAGTSRVPNSDPSYIPENNPKFPLPYYLVPEEDIHYFISDALDPRVSDQLILQISGKKHYKFFIHPEAEAHYDFLRAAYNYISADKSEFMASPTFSYNTLLVWNKNSNARRPFLAKVSMEKNAGVKTDLLISIKELEHAVANQKVYERYGEKKRDEFKIKIFPQTAGLIIEKHHPGEPQKIGGQLIGELPEELINGDKKWLSFSSLLSAKGKDQPLILEILAKNNLTAIDFFEKYMVSSYLNMFETITLKNGMNFETHPQDLMLEVTRDSQLTGKWVLRNFEDVVPDLVVMAKANGPVDVFMEDSNAVKFNSREGRIFSVGSYVLNYKRQVFDLMLEVLSKSDTTLTPEKKMALKNLIDFHFAKLINTYYGINFNEAPTINNYHLIENRIIEETELDARNGKKEIKESENLRTFIEIKKDNKEWMEFSPKKGKSEFFLTDYGLYEISNKKIIGMALFNHNELEDYKSNNKMLTIFNYVPVARPKSGCFSLVFTFFK